MNQQSVTTTLLDQPAAETTWGRLIWLVGDTLMPGAEQSLGIATIAPGQRNPLHAHPNCEELLYVLSGECEHKLGDTMVHLKPGSVIRIPRGVPHWARCTTSEPLTAVISFSSPARQTVTFEDGEIA